MTMNKTRVRVSIVIPAYNEERHLRACLQAIADQTVKPYEVIVVDNNSTDGTVAITKAFPFAIVVDEPRQGIVYARNTGFNAASGDIIGRIDADIQLPRHWVEHVQKFYADPRHQNAAWTGPGVFYNVSLPHLVSRAYNLHAFWMNKLFIGHFSLWGSNMAFTATQWKKVRHKVCLRTDIHEDLDLSIHLHRAGYKISYDTTMRIRAELRRVHSERHKLWVYLGWWPQALKVHNLKAWPIIWFFGVLMLYLAAGLLAAVDGALKHFGKRDSTVAEPER